MSQNIKNVCLLKQIAFASVLLVLSSASLSAGPPTDVVAQVGEERVDTEAVITSRTPRRKFCLSDESVQFAKRAELIWFDRNLSGGAHTWIFNGAEVLKALNAYCGDSRLDAELLAQIRYILAGNKGPTATGGFQDQKQLGAALMFLLAKNTPRIWRQLTLNERKKIHLNMEAHLYSTVFTTKDGVATSLGIDGNTGLHRDWNPNFQNGMVGLIIMTSLYWGSDEFEAKLRNFDYSRFVAKLEKNGMTNLLSTYQNAASPSQEVVENGIRKIVDGSIYSFHGIKQSNLLGLFGYIADRTLSQTVNCGLNGGAGINGWGRIVQNCDTLPNSGKKGMLAEFSSIDGGGPRSSAHYSYDGWYILNYSRIALQVFDILNAESIRTPVRITDSGERTNITNIIRRYFIGTKDLYHKINPQQGGGYRDYSGGGPDGTTILDAEMNVYRGGVINLEIFNILQRSLGQRTLN